MALTRITIRQIEAFVAVADTLSFGAAGERLGLTASAVSQLVAELEATLCFRVDRSTRRVSLSSAGRDSVDVVDNITTALGIAAQGLAATLSPAYVGVVARPLGLVMRRVTNPEAIRQVCLYRPATRALLPAAEAFAEFLADWLRRWQAAASRSQRPRRQSAP